MTEQRHPLLNDLLTRSDGWLDSRENETALEYDYMTRHLTMTVIFLCWTFAAVIIGSIGNVFIIGAVMTYRRLSRNPTNIFILNLAVADLGVTAIISPVHIANVMKGPRIYYGREDMCYVIASLCSFSCIGSMLFISAVAVNRCICICKPFAYQSWFTRKKTMVYCALIWFTTGLLDMPNWIGWSAYTFRLKEMLCGVDERGNGGHIYLVVRSVAALGIPVTIVFICYMSIYRHVRKAAAALQKVQRGDVNKNAPGKDKKTNILPVKKEDIQLAITLFATFCIFMVLWSPYMFTTAVDYANAWPKELYVVAVAMGHANSLFNCFTYGVCNSNFRKGYYAFLLFILRRDANDAYKEKTSLQKCSTIATIDK